MKLNKAVTLAVITGATKLALTHLVKITVCNLFEGQVTVD